MAKTYQIKKPAAGRKIAEQPAFFHYDTQVAPCKDVRKTCPVQFVFRDGKTFLRFCRTTGVRKGSPGYMIPVSDPWEAHKLSHEACACWKKSKSFDKCRSVTRASVGLGRGAKKA